MIRTFADPETERDFAGERSRKLPPDIQQTARRKLRQLEAAEQPWDLAVPSGNRLEELKGDRKGEYSLHQRPVAGDLPLVQRSG